MTSTTIKASLAAVVAAAMLTQPALAQSDPRLAQLMINFQAADVNQNEVLHMAEFVKFINLNADHNLGQAPRIRRLGIYAAAFEAADSNDNGVVSKAEIAAQVLD